jgi:hypothetical protein
MAHKDYNSTYGQLMEEPKEGLNGLSFLGVLMDYYVIVNGVHFVL